MDQEVTALSTDLLARLVPATQAEQQWIIGNYWKSLTPENREAQRELLDKIDQELGTEESLFERARSRLLDDPRLAAGDKVKLAALMLADMYELDSFQSRQITEALREMSNPVGNVTAAINGLIQHGEVEIDESGSSGKRSHKRYRLTDLGLRNAKGLIKRDSIPIRSSVNP
jgi:hypothetical protein